MSEYFKDLLKLEKRLEEDTPEDPKLLRLNKLDEQSRIEKLNDDFYSESKPTYRPDFRKEVSPLPLHSNTLIETFW